MRSDHERLFSLLLNFTSWMEFDLEKDDSELSFSGAYMVDNTYYRAPIYLSIIENLHKRSLNLGTMFNRRASFMLGLGNLISILTILAALGMVFYDLLNENSDISANNTVTVSISIGIAAIQGLKMVLRVHERASSMKRNATFCYGIARKADKLRADSNLFSESEIIYKANNYHTRLDYIEVKNYNELDLSFTSRRQRVDQVIGDMYQRTSEDFTSSQ